MITIPTRDLTGILTDVIPMTATEDDVPALNAIRIEWDGEALHAMATDRYLIGWSTWSPDDEPDEDTQDDLFTTPGGDDDPWHVHIGLADAKDIAAAFKLPAKEGGVPLTVERRVDANGVQLVVDRSRLTGHSAITMVVRQADADDAPDVRRVLAHADTAEPTTAVAFDAKRLASFAKVRQRGPARLTFTARGVALVSIGDRFVGAIQAVREGDDVTA